MRRLMVCFLALAAAPAFAQEKTTIAVLDLQARGIDKDMADSLTDLVVKEVDRLGLFRTISLDEIRRMLEHEEDKRNLGCEDASCLAEIGGALGVDLLISGGVGKIGDTYVISLKLIDVGKADVLSREERTVSGKAEDLVGTSRLAARALLRPIMERESGMLEITCGEEGAEVYLDDVMVGMTPLAPRKVPGGYHSVRVNKKRFVVFGQDVKVEPGKTAVLEARLMPSLEYIEEYESSAKTYRALAWTFTGLAVAAAGAATGLYVWNEGRLEDYGADRRAYEDNPGDLAVWTGLEDRSKNINTVDSAALGMAITGAASVGVALFFWLAGDAPGKYEQAGKQATLEFKGQIGQGTASASAVVRF